MYNEDIVNKELIEEAGNFANQEIRPFATEFEVQERIPRELIDKMALKGYLAATFPKEYGGLGLDPINYGLLTEAIGKASSSARALLTVHTSLVGETILRWGTNEQKEKILPDLVTAKKIAAFALTEPEIGSDAKSIRTRYAQENDCYIITGNKKWISFGGIADIFLVIATGENGASAFLVDRMSEGVNVAPMRGLLANKADQVAEITFENVRVPKEHILGKEGWGFSYIVNTALDYGRYSIAWGGLAIAQEALESMATYSRTRKQFDKAIYSFQLVQGMIGDAVTNIHAARSLCLNAGYLRKINHNDAVTETTIAKYFTSKLANSVASDAVQVHGGNGCYNKYPVERLFREAKILEIIEGTSQIQQEIIARYGLRRYYRQQNS